MISMNIYQRINAVMKDVRGVGKHQRNQHANYNYAGHEAVTDALRDSFVKHGIVRVASVTDCKEESGVVTVMVEVSYLSTDDPMSRVVVNMPALQPSQTKSGQVTAQQVGQAVSYAVKNVEFKLFALTGDDTPDAEENDPERTYEQPAPRATQDDGSAVAMAYLARFGECQDGAAIKALSAEIKANWPAVRSVEGFADQMVKARKKAIERLTDDAPNPEDDGR